MNTIIVVYGRTFVVKFDTEGARIIAERKFDSSLKKGFRDIKYWSRRVRPNVTSNSIVKLIIQTAEKVRNQKQ